MSIREDVALHLNNHTAMNIDWDTAIKMTDEILELVQKGLEKELTNGPSNNKSTGNSTEVHKVPR